MDTPVLVAVVSLLGALAGSAVGGTISFLSSRAVRKLEYRHAVAQKDYDARETLYADFLAEASRLVLLSLRQDQSVNLAEEVTRIVALEARIWFHSDELGNLARSIAKAVLFEFNKASGADAPTPKSASEKELAFAHLRDKFIQKCKADLQALRTKA